MTARKRERILFVATRFVGLCLDVGLLGGAYLAAILLRFDLQAPRWGWRVMAMTFVSVAAAHIVSLIVTGCYRLPWRRTHLSDLARYLLASLLACAILTILRILLPVETYAHVRPPYTVTLITFFLAFGVFAAWRIIWSWLWEAKARDSALLERRERELTASSVADFFRGKTVLVTGAGGSIGSEIVRQVSTLKPAKLIMVERSENALYEIDREINHGAADEQIAIPLMKDVNDEQTMESIFSEYHPEIVLHAAAYKHVPMVEANPEEGWRNNTEATKKLAELAQKCGVARFVLISTDKAVNPVSVMGKTKRAAEEAVMALEGPFCAVRFGNVLGSSGSVVPLFKEQIRKGGPVTVTHPEMKRYFMTVSEAVGLVLQAASRSEKAIYTLDMGEPVSIVSLAEDMIRQAGFKPYVDIPIVFTGIRPGEKLFEELDVSEKSCYSTDMAKIYITR